MLRRFLLLMLVFAAASVAASAAPIDGKRIGDLIEKLGSGKFQERNAAQKELEAIGPAALAQLKAVKAEDPETDKRARELVRKIEEKVFTAALLEPKRITLSLDEAPVLEAVAALAKASAYVIDVAGDRTKIADKKITLDARNLPFWEVLDKLCSQAGLVEGSHLTGAPERAGVPVNDMRIVIEGGRPLPVGIPGRLVLVPGTPEKHVSYTGSVRIAVTLLKGGTSAEPRLKLDALAEPRLHGFSVSGSPTLENALDERGQRRHLRLGSGSNAAHLAEMVRTAYEIAGSPVTRSLTLNLQTVPQAAKALKEMSGSLTAQVVGPPEPLITIEKVLEAAGTSAQGKNGGSLRLSTIEKSTNGDYRVQISIESPSGMGPLAFRGARALRVGQPIPQSALYGTASQQLPELLDADGQKFQVDGITARRISIVNGMAFQEATVVFHPGEGQGEPDRLVLQGSRMVSVTVPFSFRDVPLE